MNLSYASEALLDLERVSTFLLEAGYEAPENAVRTIVEALRMLKTHPFVGKSVRRGLRVLVISFGRAGYLASYRVTETGVEILRIRHQREAGTKL